MGTLPFWRTKKTVNNVRDFFPFTQALNPLEPALDNLGHVFHLPVMLYNTALWLGEKPWRFYVDGYANPQAQRMVSLLEQERQAIALALKIKTQTAQEFLLSSYGVFTKNDDLGETLRTFGYYERKGPHANSLEEAISIENGLRQITEEYYCKLCPLLEFSHALELSSPAMDELYEQGKELGLQPKKFARNLNNLGIPKKNPLPKLYSAYGYE